MAASYPSSIKSFTTRVDGQTIADTWFNGIHDEVVAIETALIDGFAHIVKPVANNTYDLGTSALRWKDLYVANDVFISDSGLLTFGTGNDATLTYDGTDLILSPAAVGSGDVVVSGGSVEFDDNEGVTLGTGKDATIQYDGTDLAVNPRAVGSGFVKVAGGVKSSHATAGIGYATGAGGTVTQGAGSGKATGVTLNTITGQITMNNAALASDTRVQFTLTNSAIAAADLMVINLISGGTQVAYIFDCSPGAGTATIGVRNITTGSLSEALVLGFAVIKAVTA